MSSKSEYRIGIDVGSTSVKVAVVNSRQELVWSRYCRHNAQVKPILTDCLREVQQLTHNAEIGVCVTGSVGMNTSELLQVRFVQEVVGAATYTHKIHPEAKALIDIGGEDSKVVLFERGQSELRMNGNCAGGTGSFIDQMASLLGISIEEMNQLALSAERYHPIAARCGVFAKTDVQNLISKNVSQAEIAASIFHSIAVQTVTTLAHGCTIQAPVLLCGGPLTFCAALRKAFAEYMHLTDADFIISPESHLIPAIGCALSDEVTQTTIHQLLQRMEDKTTVTLSTSLPRLFNNEDEYKQWQQDKKQFQVKISPLHTGVEQVVIGIDSGSTTTKIVAARPNGDIVFCHYVQSHGHPIQAATEGLSRLQQLAIDNGTTLQILSSCSTGYGEDLVKAALKLDYGIIETMAHYQAANKLKPGVSFILDIGGQDMKAIFVHHGIIRRMELNEACSSGCGTFLQTFAQGLGYSIDDFSHAACRAQHPCDLGTRCTVFMNSKIKQVLREGAEVADIAAGLAYSVVNNCLYKVLKLQRIEELGDEIVVQGGTMRNDAVVRALELLTGKSVARSSMPEMMGAYGCALYCITHLHEVQQDTQSYSIAQMTESSHYEQSIFHCGGCENHCSVTRYHFANGNNYYSGNQCERVISSSGRVVNKGLNIYTDKYRLLFDRPCPTAERKIGIPRALGMYEEYPFWHRLLTECGFQVVLSPESDNEQYEQSLNTVMSDNICFPAKLVHSHILALQNLGVERILMPYVIYERKDDDTAINSYNCPIVSGYVDVIKSVIPLRVPLDAPAINLTDQTLLRQQIVVYLSSLNISSVKANRAFSAALSAQADYERAIQQRAEQILNQSRQHGQLSLLLAGRPYHTDPLVQHRLSDMVASMGVNVISEDIVRNRKNIEVETNSVRQWVYVNRIIRGATWVAQQGSDVQMVELTSFGCGPDSFIQDEVRDILDRQGKSLTLLKIDDIGNVGSLRLRVRSLIESIRIQGDEKQPSHPFLSTRIFRHNDYGRTILAPYISEYVTPLLEAVASLAGLHLEVLPESDQEAANIGLRYANNEVCYPATLVVGSIIQGLQSGKYDLNNTAVAMSQTGGQCRATNYAGLIKRAMVNAGFADVPLITLGVSGKGTANQQEFEISYKALAAPIAWGLVFADVLSKMYNAAVIRERTAGSAVTLRDQYLAEAADLIRAGKTSQINQLIARMATHFDAISTDKETVKVGLVGEIFLKFNHFSHQQIAQQLIDRGYEVAPPLLLPFFLQEFVNGQKNRLLHMTHKGSLAARAAEKVLYGYVQRILKKADRAASRYRYYRPFANIFHQAELTEGVVSPCAQFGEGWLLPAEVMEFAESGINNVISLQPFGCIANHVVARGIERTIRSRYPQLNYLILDFDSGVSRVNVTNRLLLFLDNAH